MPLVCVVAYLLDLAAFLPFTCEGLTVDRRNLLQPPTTITCIMIFYINVYQSDVL